MYTYKAQLKVFEEETIINQRYLTKAKHTTNVSVDRSNAERNNISMICNLFEYYVSIDVSTIFSGCNNFKLKSL